MRHGRTAWNVAGRFQGHTDVPLDATGREQAHALAAALAGESFDRAIASDLTRARSTAQIVLGSRTIPLESDARWRELRFGAWEGLTWDEIRAREPAVGERAHAIRGYVAPEGGETFDELVARVAAALADVAEAVTAGDRVLVATHAGPLHALLRVALGAGPAEALAVTFAPGSATRLRFADGSAQLVEPALAPPSA